MLNYVKSRIMPITSGFLISMLLSISSPSQAQDYKSLIESFAKSGGVPSKLMVGICSVESDLNPYALNPKDGGKYDSIGLCQIQEPTAKTYCKTKQVKSLKNANMNAACAVRILKAYLNRFNGNWVKSISAYNAGPNRKGVPNHRYVDKVFKRIELIYGK